MSLTEFVEAAENVQIGPIIFRKDANGATRVWHYKVLGDKWCTVSGILGGTLAVSKWTVCKPKSKPTAEEQASFEAEAELQKKLDREYRRTPEELDSVPLSPMLAHDYAKLKKPLAFPVLSQPKLDGIRATISRHGAFSREYQRHHNVDHILEALAPVFAKFPKIIFDGELYNHDLRDDFNQIASVVRKQKVTDAQRAEARRLVQYHIYDAILPDLSHNTVKRQAVLRAALDGIATDHLSPKHAGMIEIVLTMPVVDQNGLDHLYGTYLEHGYEGQMVRLADAPYEADKRSKNLLKRKEFITAEFPLLRIEEGQGNWAGFAKRIVFRLPDGRECGAGLRGTQDFARDLLEKAKIWGVSAAVADAPVIDVPTLADTPADIEARSEPPAPLGTHEVVAVNGPLVTIRHFKLTPDGVPRFPVAIDFHPEGRRD